MKKLQYICVQPRIIYYAWQVEVMINNFIRNGINPNDINILLAYNLNDSTSSDENIKLWNQISEKYKNVNFFFYEDTRKNFDYIPSIYFNILKQHIKKYPELQSKNNALFLHDCDTIFTKPVDFSEMLNDDIWYLSDTVGYIGTQYILTKGDDIYKNMCDIIGIDTSIPKERNSNSGGAQHIVKNTTYEYWDKVEKDSIRLYNYFSDIEPYWSRPDYPIQKWTSGMWSLLWNAWLFGNETRVDKRLDFCWATDMINYWNIKPIYHNAGVTNETHLFNKSFYINEFPHNLDLEKIDKNYCSYKYAQYVKSIFR